MRQPTELDNVIQGAIPYPAENLSIDPEIELPLSKPEKLRNADTGTHEKVASRKWREFVDEVARHANATLISLMRNAVIMELTDQHLVIGYQNIQVFTDDKRAQIERTARTFFNPSIQVVFRESDDGIDDSLMAKHDIAKAKEHAKTKEIARNDSKVQEILNIFPDAEIDEIIILDEKKKDD